MRRRRLAIIAAVVPVCLYGAAAAQTAKPAPNWTSLPGGSWESITKLPDWQGVWTPSGGNGAGKTGPGIEQPQFTPAAKTKADELLRLRSEGGDVPSRTYHCVTRGFPGNMANAEAIWQFAYTPGQVVMTDVEGPSRHIYTDGRPHADSIITFNGDSIGHWEGDTLVVDTTSLDPGNEFVYGLGQGNNSHVVERMRLSSPDNLQIQFVLDAPEAITAPYHFTDNYKRNRGMQMTEFDCAQNNRDIDLDKDAQTFDITPPPH